MTSSPSFPRWLARQLAELAILAAALTLAADWLGGMTGWWPPVLHCGVVSGLLSPGGAAEGAALLLVSAGFILTVLGQRKPGAWLLLAGFVFLLAGAYTGQAVC
ncbi:hypothetical protein [Rhodoplanes sp. SY1]|uniref:hypothetical protein n=1 Tax=Rhodoplanes sp. SY1 TaxID=3166646 RepID=UPI0038B637CF